MSNIINQVLEAVTLFAERNDVVWLERLCMRITHPVSEYPWLYYRDWADGCNDPY